MPLLVALPEERGQVNTMGGTRQPRQSRSQATKDKILESAYKLFCERGYYQTTTNHIADSAGVSIGSLYSYYNDREEILADILKQFDSSLNQALDDLSNEKELCRSDIGLWVQRVIERMASLQEPTRELYNQLRSLQYAYPKVAEVLHQQKARETEIILEYLRLNADMVRVEDLDVAAFVVQGMIEVVVDEMIFPEDGRDQSKILAATVEAICRYLF
jgi:AcrR family transcriptional regulator